MRYSVHARVLEGAGSLIMKRDEGAKSGTSFCLGQLADKFEESELKHKNFRKYVLEIQPDAGFAGGRVVFELTIESKSDLVLKSGSKTCLQPRAHKIFVSGLVVPPGPAAAKAGPGVTVMHKLPSTVCFFPLDTISLCEAWSCTGANADESVCALKTAALMVMSLQTVATMQHVTAALAKQGENTSLFQHIGSAQRLYQSYAQILHIFKDACDEGAQVLIRQYIASFSESFKCHDDPDFAKANKYQITMDTIGNAILDTVSLGELVHMCCNVMKSANLCDPLVVDNLLALIPESGKLCSVATVLSSQMFAVGDNSKDLRAYFFAVGHGIVSGNWIHLLETAALAFATTQDPPLTTIQSVLSGHAKPALHGCQALLLSSKDEGAKKLRKTLDLIEKSANGIMSDTKATNARYEIMTIPFVLAGLAGVPAPKKIISFLDRVILDKKLSDIGVCILELVQTILEVAANGSYALQETCRLATMLFNNKHKATAFRDKAPDDQIRYVEKELRNFPEQMSDEDKEVVVRRISDALSHLTAVDVSQIKAHKFVDVVLDNLRKAADVGVDADAFENEACGAVKRLLKATFTSTPEKQLSLMALLSESFNIIMAVTKLETLLKPVEKSIRKFIENNSPESAINLVKALVDFGAQSAPAMITEAEHDVACLKYECLARAVKECSEPFNTLLERELSNHVPDAGVRKDVVNAIQRNSWSSSNYSAQAIQGMYQDAVSCIQGNDDKEIMLMCAVRRAFSSSCALRVKALLLALPAAIQLASAARVKKIMKACQLSGENTIKNSDGGEVMQAIWAHLARIVSYLPENMKRMAAAGMKLLELEGDVLDESNLCHALISFKEVSGNHESVTWIIQILMGAAIGHVGAKKNMQNLQVEGLIMLLCALQSVVRRAGTDEEKMLNNVDGTELLMHELAPIFPERPLSEDLCIMLQEGEAHVLRSAAVSSYVSGGPRGGRFSTSAVKRQDESTCAATLVENYEYAEYVQDLFRMAKHEAADMDDRLKHIIQVLFPHDSRPSMAAFSTRLHDFVNAFVLVKPVVKTWLHTCAHMSRIVQTQTPFENEIPDVAERLFIQGLRLVRILHTILLVGRPLSAKERTTLEDIEKLAVPVTDIMRLLATEVRHKDFVVYIAEASSLAQGGSQSKRVDHFQLPARSKYGPGHVKHERAVDRDNYIKSGQAKWLKYEEEDLTGVPAYNEDDDVGGPESDMQVPGKLDTLRNLKSEELVEVDIDPDLQWIDTSLLQVTNKGGKLPRGAMGRSAPSSTSQARNAQDSAMKVASMSGSKHQVPANDARTAQDFDLSGNAETTLQAQEGVKVKVDIRINAAVIREQLRNADIQEIYKNIPLQKRRNAQPIADPVSCSIKPGERDTKWTYQRLVECEQMTKNIENVLRVLRLSISDFCQTAKHPYQFEFLVCVDNSGSMAPKERFVIEALVVLIEVLRKLEFRFAIALWGREPGKLLLDFDRDGGDDHFNLKKGQEIIQSLTFDQPSRIASCLSSICERVWPAKVPKPPHTKRLAITLFDGFSEEAQPENFTDLKREHDFSLGMLLIDEHHRTDHAEFLKAICATGCHSILDVDQVDMLHKQVVLLLSRMFEYSKKVECEKRLQTGEPHKIDIALPSKDDLKGKVSVLDVNWFHVTPKNALQDESLRGVGGERSLIAVSRPGQLIPMLTHASEDDNLVQAVRGADWSTLEERLRQHQDYYRQLEQEMRDSTALSDSLHEQWTKTTLELAAQIDEYVSALEEVVVPFNKYSRRRCALKGSSLHLPGLVKAVISNFTYKKFFSQKTAGGKRNYSVCLALDVSASMNGHLGNCAQETLICLIAALHQIGISFSIVLFGQRVRIIKTEEQEWGPAVLWTLLNYRTSRDSMTMDADGIQVALQLVARKSSGGRKVFVLTDGYGTCGLRLPLVLESAQAQGADVVALAVGVDRTHVKDAYNRFALALVPAVVPQALRALYMEESYPPENVNHDIIHITGEGGSIQDILKNPEKILDMMTDDMSQAREANLIQGDKPGLITVDVAFCLDCTGSMSAWIAAAKGQIVTIVKGITDAVDKEFPGLSMQFNFALVGFRDFGDPDQFIVYPPAGHDFTNDAEAFCKQVQSIVAKGGGDGPEDLLGALHLAGTALKWESRIKFLIVITDAPAHGRECNDDASDRYAIGDPQGHTMSSVIRPLAEKKVDLMFCRVKKSYTKKTEEAMAKYYTAHAAEGDVKEMSCVDLFDDTKQETGCFHFVFCLDESGSMEGPKWQALLNAYTTFINKRRNDQGLRDYVSVVTFDDQWRSQGEFLPINRVGTTLTFRGGGTNFDAALIGAAQALAKTPQGVIPMIIFMSDGQGDGNPVPTLQGLRRQYPGFVCHCVGLGDDADIRTLQTMATAGGGHARLTQMDTIAAAFGEIAAGCAAMDGMVAKFGEEIAKMVATRICLDHM